MASDQTLDIGPVRAAYYRVLAYHRDSSRWFPFGTKYPLLDIERIQPYNIAETNPAEWLENDTYLTHQLYALGISWYETELAIGQAFATESSWKGQYKNGCIIGAHNATIVRVAMFHSGLEKNAVREWAKGQARLYDKARSLFPSQRDSIVALQWKWNLEDFGVRSHLPKDFTNYKSLQKSPFVTPVVQAIAKTIIEKMEDPKPQIVLAPALRRILDARLDYLPISPMGVPGRLRADLWDLVAAIGNHLRSTIFGIRIAEEDVLTRHAVQQRFGDTNRERIVILRP